MAKINVEAKIYSYTGPRFSGDGVAWAAIRNADQAAKTTQTISNNPTFNGYTREEIGTLYARYRCGQIRRSDLENTVGLAFIKIRKNILRR